MVQGRRSAARQEGWSGRSIVMPSADFVADAAMLRASPQFRPALAGYCQGIAEAPPLAWPTIKLVDQLRRYLVCYLLIHNYHAWKSAGGPLPTVATLQATLGSGARQAAEMVAALKARGLLRVEGQVADRRPKLLVPAPALVAEIGRSVRLFVAAADRIAGRHPGRAVRLADPQRLGEVLYRSAAEVAMRGTLIHPFPRVLYFAERDCGYLLLTVVLGAHYAETVPGAPAAVPLNRKAIAERIQVSLAHVGNMFTAAKRHGWFAVGGGRLLAIGSDLVDEFERWASWQMVHFDRLAALVLADEPEPTDEPEPEGARAASRDSAGRRPDWPLSAADQA